MSLTDELRKMLASLERELIDNGRDIDATDLRYKILAEERRKMLQGIEGIKAELSKLEGD